MVPYVAHTVYWHSCNIHFAKKICSIQLQKWGFVHLHSEVPGTFFCRNCFFLINKFFSKIFSSLETISSVSLTLGTSIFHSKNCIFFIAFKALITLGPFLSFLFKRYSYHQQVALNSSSCLLGFKNNLHKKWKSMVAK